MAKKTVENGDRTGLRRIYRKSWPYDNLFGSSRFELSSADRGVWNDLIDMAKLSRVKPGIVAAAKNQPYSHEWLANFLNIPLIEFEHALDVLKQTKRIWENGTGIEIINWKKYQTEYDRQAPYRQGKKEAEEDPDKYVKGKYGHMVNR